MYKKTIFIVFDYNRGLNNYSFVFSCRSGTYDIVCPSVDQRGPTHLGVFIYSVIKLHKQFDKKYMDKYFI